MNAVTTRILAIAALSASLGACTDGGSSLNVARHLVPVTAETRALMQERGMEARAPIMVRIFKAEGQLEVFMQQRGGRYALLRTFDICRWSGDLGPKIREGDRQAPEGFYSVTPTLMNPRSALHLSFNTGYPNAFDQAHGRTGSHLMVHGDCSSRGCFAMTNAQMEEIYALARDAFDGGQRSIQLQILPFRMTAENMFRYRNDPNIAFWRNLQEGYQHFEATGRPPEVQVCGRRYVFNQRAIDTNGRFTPGAACPPAEVPTELRVQIAQRRAADARQLAELEAAHRIGTADPSVTAMVATLSSARPVSSANRPPHHLYATRQQIIAALPRSSPEALSMLPGAENGPTDELRRIARGESIGGPPLPSAAVASTEPSAGPAVARTPANAVAATAVAAAAQSEDAGGFVGGLLAFPSARNAAVTDASAPARAPTANATRQRSTRTPGTVTATADTRRVPAAGAAPTGNGTAAIIQPAMLQRVLGVLGVSAAP